MPGQSVDEKIIKTLTNDIVIKIFLTLTTEPMNTRGLSRVLGVNEAIVSRKLKTLEKLGLVESKWVRIKGRNVKLYYPRTHGYTIHIGPRGVEVKLEEEKLPVSVDKNTPSLPQIFVGRERELSIISDERRRFIYIVGIPGVGKTALVAKYAQSSDYKPIWFDLVETSSLGSVIRELTFSLDEPVRRKLVNLVQNAYGNASLLIDFIVHYVRNNKVLFVFDNYHLNSDPALDHLVKTLTQINDSLGKTIVISRSMPRFYLPKENILELKPLSRKDSITMLEKLGVKQSDAIKAYESLGGFPYLLILFARKYRENPVSALSLLGNSAEYLLYEILSELSYDERTIMNMLCTLRRTASISLLKRTGIRQGDIRRSIEKLLSKLLILRYPSGYQISETVRDYYCKSFMDREFYHYIAATYYSNSNRETDLLESLYHYMESLRCDESLRSLSKISHLIIDNELAITPYLDIIRRIRECSSNNLVKAWASFVIARTMILRGDLENAFRLLVWAESIAYDRSDHRLLLYSKIEKALIHRYMGRYQEAIKELKKAKRILDHAHIRGKDEIRIKILMSLAPIYYFSGKLDKARRILELLRNKYLDPMDSFRRGIITGWLSLIYRTLYDHDKSMKMIDEAIRIFKELGTAHSIAIAYREKALTLFTASRFEESVEFLRKAIETLEKNGPEKYMVTLAGAYIDLSILYFITGKTNSGDKALRKAKDIVETNKLNTPEYTYLLSIAEALLCMTKKNTDCVESNIRKAYTLLEKASYFRKLFGLTIMYAIRIMLYGKEGFAEEIRGKIEHEIVNLAEHAHLNKNLAENIENLTRQIKTIYS